MSTDGHIQQPEARPKALGKSLFLEDRKLYVRGVTYGTFGPNQDTGEDYPSPATIDADFAEMAANGINAVRTYTVPPKYLLDLARRHGLWVMVGIPWEQHITFLDDRRRAAEIEQRVRAGVRSCNRHPAILCYAIGNEIPASIVRWHGRHRIERFLRRLYRAGKAEDPEALVTYVNYPSTEYLHLDFVDLCAFNVFLESGPALESYLARLQNIAGNRPLILTETGLDSLRNSEEGQARALQWQVRAAFAAGCAGTFVFAWTDEWHRGGCDIDEWAFGLVGRDREPKPALAEVGRAFAEAPFRPDPAWPRVSVVVCTFNDEDTIGECLTGLAALDYPDYEVIVVNDGSTDRTEAIAHVSGFRVVTTVNQGLACARNVGLDAATGEIVAYIDADACPDPHWLSHLSDAFTKSAHVGIGGPNIPPPGDGELAECVANAPGGPIHVLLSDQVAEHIPGCNMAFWKAGLEEIGGFDPQFRVAGDDVDICWRLQDHGQTVGFCSAAVVWHHRRGSTRSYLKQQFEYGKAEALLERKWPERYNRAGHLAWAGRVYGHATAKAFARRRWKIYYGTWGTGLFQSVYQHSPGLVRSLPLMPEWYLVVAALAAISALGLAWTPLLAAIPLLVIAAAGLVVESVAGGMSARFADPPRSRFRALRMRGRVAVLHALQPAARLTGRLSRGLSPWRRPKPPRLAFPRHRTSDLWSESWRTPDDRLRGLEAAIRRNNGVVFCGGDYERWDMDVRGGLLGGVRMRMAVEEHGSGRQMMRFRSWPRVSRLSIAAVAILGGLAGGAALQGSGAIAALLLLAALLVAGITAHDCAAATGILVCALEDTDEHPAVGAGGAVRRRPVTALNGGAAGGIAEVPLAGGAASGASRPLGASNGAGEGLALPSRLDIRDTGMRLSDLEE